MELNPIGIAVPFFIGFLALEYWVASRRGRGLHRLNDTFANLSCGMGDQLIGLFLGVAVVGLYALIEGAVGLWDLSSSSLGVWLGAFFAVDFFYYWYHRFSHRVGIGWATHVVHHHSEEYNLAVALRQSWFSQFYSWVFYMPLAFAGVPWEVWVTCYSLNLIYQFWIHTELIDRLGPLEWVMNTPSHHRVHHGINDAYLDTNYAGVFIIWDRLFGTFVPEREPVLYGTRKPLRSWNPWTANAGPLLDLWRRSRVAQTPEDRKRVWWAPPEWVAEGEEFDSSYPPAGRGYDCSTGREMYSYAIGQLGVLVCLVALLLTFEAGISLSWKLLAAFFIGWTLFAWAGIFERRPWARLLECARLAGMAGIGALMAVGSPHLVVFGWGLVVIAATSAYDLWCCRAGFHVQSGT